MRPATTILLITVMSVCSSSFAQHRSEVLEMRAAMRELNGEMAQLQSVLDRETSIAQELYDAISVVAEDQEHNAAEKAMAHVLTARRLVEEGPRHVHLGRMVAVAQEMVLNRRQWIHSVDLYDMREEYHHRVIHPLILALTEDLELLSQLESEGLVLSQGLLESRAGLTRVQKRLMSISDLRYE